MAKREIAVPQISFDEGMTIAGYLITKSEVAMTDETTHNTNSVPKIFLRDESGATFSALLGATAKDSMMLLVVGQWTEITKGKKVLKSGGRGYYPYAISQDDEKVIK